MAFNDGRVVSNFIVQGLHGEPMSLYGNGNQTRSFCYVSDLVDGLIRLMDGNSTIGPVNIGNPREFKVKELGEYVWSLLGKQPRYEYRSLPQDDPTRRQPDISAATEFLGWTPQIELQEGLELTIADFKQRMDSDGMTPTPVLHQREAQVVTTECQL